MCTAHPPPNGNSQPPGQALPGEEWIDQIREAVRGKVYTDEQVKDIRAILR